MRFHVFGGYSSEFNVQIDLTVAGSIPAASTTFPSGEPKDRFNSTV